MGKWSAIAIVLISIAYILTGLTWMALNPDGVSTQRLQPTEPFLTILETLILLLTPAIVLLFAAIHGTRPLIAKRAAGPHLASLFCWQA